MREMEEWNDGMQEEDYAGEAIKLLKKRLNI